MKKYFYHDVKDIIHDLNSLIFEFQENEISLNIPKDLLVDEWTIDPLTTPSVS